MTQCQARRVPSQLPARQFSGCRKKSLAQVAGTLCTLPAFWTYLGLSSEAEASEYVRNVCGVKSRAELDTNPAAAQLFHDYVRRPFARTRES
jgi:hypothetical protein